MAAVMASSSDFPQNSRGPSPPCRAARGRAASRGRAVGVPLVDRRVIAIPPVFLGSSLAHRERIERAGGVVLGAEQAPFLRSHGQRHNGAVRSPAVREGAGHLDQRGRTRCVVDVAVHRRAQGDLLALRPGECLAALNCATRYSTVLTSPGGSGARPSKASDASVFTSEESRAGSKVGAFSAQAVNATAAASARAARLFTSGCPGTLESPDTSDRAVRPSTLATGRCTGAPVSYRRESVSRAAFCTTRVGSGRAAQAAGSSTRLPAM